MIVSWKLFALSLGAVALTLALFALPGCVPSETRYPAGPGELLDTNGVPVDVEIER